MDGEMETTTERREFEPPELVAIARRMLAANGCDSTVGGHVSVRAPDSVSFFISPFEYFDETMPEAVSRLDFDLNLVDGGRLTAPAAQFHRTIYRRRPDINCVVHTHSKWVSILSSMSQLVGMYHDDAVILKDDQVFHEEDGIRPVVDGDLLADRLGPERHVIIMKNHGAIVTGATVADATIKALVLERCAEIQFYAQLGGGTELADAFVQKARAPYTQYYIPQMWASNVRRLRRSDPDLMAVLDRVREVV